MSTQLRQVPFIDLKAQHTTIHDEVQHAINDVIDSSAFILGREVTLFEEEFAAFCGADYAIGVDSGTSALELVLRAWEIGPGDEVITVANTFIATVLAISHTGATPVLVDVDPCTLTMHIPDLEAAVTARTRAIIPVHLYGQPADMDPILAIAQQHDLYVLEDACQAHGAYYKERRVGGIGHAAAFSFYPAKNLGAFGDGGMIVTNDAHVAARVRSLRDYGQTQKYHHDVMGYNRRLDSLQASVLRVKLRYLDTWNEHRRAHAAQYLQRLPHNGLRLPVEANYADAVWHLFVIRVPHRDELRAYLTEHSISTGIHYPIPIHRQRAYASLGYAADDFPVTTHDADQLVSLPMYPEMSGGMVDYVAETLLSFLHQRADGHL